MDIRDSDTPGCTRCGTCCKKGGPALHEQDLPLFQGKDALEFSQLVTLRRGETAFDQLRGQLAPLEHEIVKIKGQNGGWTCILFDAAQNACRAYVNRPAECRALSCQDTSALAAMYEAGRLTRADLLPPGSGMLAVMAEHDALAPAGRIPLLALALRAGGQEGLDAADELTRMALADRAFRSGLAERAGIGPEYHDFFLGRGAEELFAAAGVALRADVRTGLRAQPDPLWRPEP